MRRLIAAALGAGVITAGLAGCATGSGISATPIESSIGTAFANLYALQQHDEGNPVPAPQKLHTRASCLKGTPGSPQSGAGADWTCDVTFLVAGPATPVTAIYNLTVQADGCYAADGDGPMSVNGSRTVTGPGYRQEHNPLWLIDGCTELR